ncbi:lysyl oxidase family protein [Micromonospora sp. NPDC003776]
MTVRRVLAVVAAVAAVVSGGSVAVAAPAEPQLRFVAAARSVTVESYPDYGVALDLGTNLVAGKSPFEVRLKRGSYGDPIMAEQIVNGSAAKRVALPVGLVTDFAGFPAFTHVTITGGDGAVVLERDESFCPNSWYTTRTRPDAPDRSPYPQDCPTNPFTIGSVWGIQAGWSAPAGMPWWQAEPVDLAAGTYTAMVRVNQPYLDLFGIPADQASVTIELNVREYQGDRLRAATGANAARTGATLTPGTRPAGKNSIPKNGPRPDLRSLPAWGIQIGGYGESDGRDYLSFNATVWDAGQSPLVVDGFRRSGEDVMDAYQYFYDAKGKQTGYAQVGTMEWDARDGHHHWHFTDFAQYRLLDENAQLAVRSGKEAFCLANTDAVDYTLPSANWRPGNTDLHTACGDQSSLAVREVLDVGSGDTYGQYLPGQSFDITDLPNGTYYIEVAANPGGRLYESDTTNNTSRRKVILGGEPGARTVEVPPHQGIIG